MNICNGLQWDANESLVPVLLPLPVYILPPLLSMIQHYQIIHGQKSYTCAQCGKTFALRDACNRHQTECRQKIVCATCGLDFRSRNALYQHAKRKGHALPDGRKQKASSKSSKTAKASGTKVQVVLVPIPTSVKTVVPIPRKKELVSSSTQTEECPSLLETSAGNVSSSRSSEVGLQSSGSQTVVLMSELPLCSMFDHTHLLCSPSELLSLGTQTTFPPETISAEVSTQACQTLAAQLCDFGTQTHVASHQATQSLVAVNDSTSLSSPECSLCFESECGALNLVEFGTQTIGSESYGIGELDVVDFGTQTVGMSGFGLDDSLFCSHLLPSESLDFGTQTLESSYDSLSLSQSMQTFLHRDQSSQTYI